MISNQLYNRLNNDYINLDYLDEDVQRFIGEYKVILI